ncbi:MAG TPA: universal stress protein [Gillisia sp.]|nr:universal stress protein [Gillisia sp.]
MKKILVPTDFSENAYNALKYGVNLFPGEECVYYILHTYTPALYNAEFMVYANLSLDEIYRLNVNKSLSQVVSRIKKEFPDTQHSFKKIACFSLLQDEIKNQVNKKGIDLIIMGSQGVTGAAQILFGTQTIHTIKGANCPVLAVPAHAEFYPPSNLLFATDFEPDVTEDHLQIIKDIAVSHQSKIHILHIMRDTPLDSEKEKNKEALANYFKDSQHKFHIIKSETVTEGILNFQKENYLDVLVMVRHKHTFFQNLFLRPVVDKVGFHLSTPYLVIPVLNES